MLILEEFNDTWNYTFIIVSVIAIMFGTAITLLKIKKNKFISRREKRNNAKKDT